MRNFSINVCNNVSSPGWRSIIDKREAKSVIYCEFEIAEEVIAMIEFKDKTFEVGIGECLRPYIPLYHGVDRENASAEFIKAINERKGE